MTPMTVCSRIACVSVLLVGVFGATGAVRCETVGPLQFPGTQYQPVDWADLDGWAADDHASAFATFFDSCRALTGKGRPSAGMTQIAEALRDVCERAQAAVPLDDDGARKFFEDNFRPVQISQLGESERLSDGLLRAHHRRFARANR